MMKVDIVNEVEAENKSHLLIQCHACTSYRNLGEIYVVYLSQVFFFFWKTKAKTCDQLASFWGTGGRQNICGAILQKGTFDIWHLFIYLFIFERHMKQWLALILNMGAHVKWSAFPVGLCLLRGRWIGVAHATSMEKWIWAHKSDKI